MCFDIDDPSSHVTVAQPVLVLKAGACKITKKMILYLLTTCNTIWFSSMLKVSHPPKPNSIYRRRGNFCRNVRINSLHYMVFDIQRTVQRDIFL